MMNEVFNVPHHRDRCTAPSILTAAGVGSLLGSVDSMTLLYYSSEFLEHDTGNHPESAGRLTPVVRDSRFEKLSRECQRPDWQPASLERLGLVHAPSYVASVQEFAEQGGGQLEVDTVVSSRSYDVSLKAAGAVCDAVNRVVRGDDQRAFCMVRPPGHHAMPAQAMGFCLLNNVAVGSRMATTELDIDRVLIVDWDVHHGNGTQAVFWNDPRVAFLSIHRWPFYPGTGSADEIGAGDGLGTTLNLPVGFGIPRAKYLSLFRSELEQFADRIQPELLMISAGFDSHRADPIGSLGLESEDFAELTRYVLDVADRYTKGRVVSVLEGGYNPDALAECISIHLAELLERGARQPS